MEYLSHSPADTEAWACRWAHTLNGPAVIALRGDLGVGKTAFVRGLARGLGYEGRVTSPSYLLLHEYEGGRLKLYHFDWYRLHTADEVWDLGWDEILECGGVIAVEWSERFPTLVPDGAHTIVLEPVDDDPQARRIRYDDIGL